MADEAAKKETVLEEAIRITSGARQRDYGTPYENHVHIAQYWTDYLQRKGKLAPGAVIDAYDAAFQMLLVKIVREMHRPTRDNRVDIPGYSHVLQCCFEAIEEAMKQEAIVISGCGTVGFAASAQAGGAGDEKSG